MLASPSSLGRAPDPVPLQFALDSQEAAIALHRLQLRSPPAALDALNGSRDIIKVTKTQPESSGSDVIGRLSDDDDEPTPLDCNAQAHEAGGNGVMEGGTPQLAEAESLSSGNSDAEDTHLATATTTAASGYFTPPTGSPAVSPLLSLSNDSSCHSALQSESGSRASSEEVDLSQVLPAHADALAPANDNPDCDDVESILREQLHNHRLLLQRLTSAKGTTTPPLPPHAHAQICTVRFFFAENQSRGCDSRTMSLPPTDDGHGSSPASAAVNHLQQQQQQQQQDTFNYYQLQQMQNMLFPVDVSNAQQLFPVDVSNTQQLYPVDVSNAQQLFPVDVSNAQQLYPVDVSNAQQLFPTDANNAQQLFPTDASNAQQLFPVDVANSQLISQSTNFALIANLELHRRRLQVPSLFPVF